MASDLINSFLGRGMLINPEVLKDSALLEKLAKIDEEQFKGVFVIDKAFIEKQSLSIAEIPEKKDFEKEGSSALEKVKILFSYHKEPGKITVNDFVNYFNRRFETLSSFLKQRQDFQRVTSIARIKYKKERESVMFCGLVYAKSTTKKNNILLTVEDPSGKVKVVVSEKKKELFELAKEMVLDELIGVEGTAGGNFVMANQLFLPEIPLIKEIKKSPEDECLALTGDPHFGSKAFLKEEFEDFIEWLNQRKGTPEQRELASKVKYLVIIGDLVEGLGVYPGQENDLEITDIKQQYNLFAEYLKKIPSHITIIVCPGNHDAGRISEPQPPLLHEYAKALRSLPNIVLLSNPAYINIGATKEFSGFDLLLYHGYSLIYYADNVGHIRFRGGQKRADLIMKFLLQRRHLAPTHTSNQYVPDPYRDPLVIDKLPDFFITGHIHRVSVSNYKNITLVNCSCWTGITEDMEKRGLQPQPARVPIINLKTRDVKIINFLREEKQGAA
ncbi:MAG TPA: metallophosphoesterase [Candidatus Nanoarchaeia archaeon]|nr:metallophosphoesterase [Candidatus Nanoarchaeia archaeon]